MQNLQDGIKKARNRPMLFEQSAADQKALSNLAYLKATEKMIKILKDNGENPDNYISDKGKQLMEEESIKNELKARR